LIVKRVTHLDQLESTGLTGACICSGYAGQVKQAVMRSRHASGKYPEVDTGE